MSMRRRAGCFAHCTSACECVTLACNGANNMLDTWLTSSRGIDDNADDADDDNAIKRAMTSLRSVASCAASAAMSANAIADIDVVPSLEMPSKCSTRNDIERSASTETAAYA